MKTKYFFLAGFAAMLASCANEEYIGDTSPNATLEQTGDGSIQFSSNLPNMTRAGEFKGATAAEKLGGMFVVEGTKGTEATDAPSSTVVFDNYLVGYEYDHAGKTESDTHNWEYVGKESGITGSTIGSAVAGNRMTGATWSALHSAADDAKVQSIKYWDYSTSQYDFIAWSTGNREAVTDAAASGTKVKVTRINTGSTLASNGFKMTALSAEDLLQCYYTDINTVTKASNNYGQPVTLTFRNMAAKVRVGLYETVPGYSVKDVKFYSADANPAAPTDLGTGSDAANAVLFTMGSDVLPQSGEVTVYYPHIGTTHRDASPQTVDYNKASVTVGEATGGATSTTLAFGALTDQYKGRESHEAVGNFYLGRTLPNATFAGDAANSFYSAVIPNTNGKALTLRVDYTLVSTDGSDEKINVYGAKAVVPATYTKWLPNYAYTYIFKISDNTNGWTSQTNTDKKGLFPITFDAVVTSFVDANAEQTTVTTVATPSITTYQQGHTKATNEYSKTQKAGTNATKTPWSDDYYRDLYVQVMENSGTPSLVTTLAAANSLLFSVSDENASEAQVMDALQNRTNTYNAENPVGRNGITLTKNTNISNTVTEIVNGVNDLPISVASGSAAKIDIDNVGVPAGTYAYVYVYGTPTADEKIYNVVSDAAATAHPENYYEVVLDGTETPLGTATAAADKLYFVKNVDEKGDYVSYTFKQTKVGDDVTGLVEIAVPSSKASTFTSGHFYFEVYNQNNGKYAVKVIKIVA